MKITDSININFKKLKARKSKALFLIIPITILAGLSVIVSSQIMNIKNAVDEAVFGTIENQSRVLQITKDNTSDNNDPRQFLNPQETQFSESDVETIESIDNVESAVIDSALPIQNLNTSDLFDGKTISLSNLTGISPELASLYTDRSFEYTDSEAIPIVINATNFVENYEDWGGETEIEINMEDMRQRREAGTEDSQSGNTIENQSPNKTRNIEYNKDDLIGKEFTVSVGGFEADSTFTTERTDTGMKFVKLTQDELDEKEATRNETISKYWDYDKLKTPITYKFVVVGVLEDSSTRSSYIPVDAGNQIIHDYIQHQLDSRNSTEISTDVLNSTYLGLTYDGTELSSAGNVFGTLRGRFGPGLGIGPGGGDFRPDDHGSQSTTTTTTASESYTVPGLVIETTDEDSPEVVGLYTDADVYTKAFHYGQTVTLIITDASKRDSVIKALNDNGYAYQDFGNQDVISNLQSSLNKATIGFTALFILFIIGVILLTMSKFVSESRKEIGIFRAIGMTKMDIKVMFVLQALLYTGIGYAVGLIIGICLNAVSSPLINSWFQNFVNSTLSQTYGVVNQVSTTAFSSVNWFALIAYTIVLIIVAFIISLIPATRASNVSPVEAITGE